MTRPVRHDLTDPAIPEGMVRITRHSSHRFIWPVHLAGWQSMGWQLQPEAAASEPEQELGEPEQEQEPQPGEPEASDPKPSYQLKPQEKASQKPNLTLTQKPLQTMSHRKVRLAD
jgi:hypothetical protein